jgi:hypothetical protein
MPQPLTESTMPANLVTFPAFYLAGLFDRVSNWWHGASAQDFGAMALAIIICVWFLSRYYAD